MLLLCWRRIECSRVRGARGVLQQPGGLDDRAISVITTTFACDVAGLQRRSRAA
jgi:hypothetical protein